MDDQQENIIRYLDNEMSDNERNAFEKLVRNDKVLEQEIALQKSIGSFLERRNPTLEQELSDLGDEFILDPTEKKSGFSVWWFIPILLILMGIVYFSFFNKKTTVLENTPTEIQEETTDEIIEENTLPVEETEEIEQNNSSTDASDDIEPTINQPIAAVDPALYQRNSVMEGILKDTYRNEGTKNETTLSSPKADQVFSYKEKIGLVLKGTTNIEPNYRLIIYSNKNTDIENDYRMLDTAIVGKETGDQYLISYSANVPLAKGLYYLVIRRDGSREVLHISRFTVE